MLVAHNIVPVAGMIFLGWEASYLLILYYLDTMVSIAGLVLFGIGRDVLPDDSLPEGSNPPRQPRDTPKTVFGVTLILGFIGILFGAPVLLIVSNSKVAVGIPLIIGAGVQLVAAGRGAFAFVLEMRTRKQVDARNLCARRLLFLILRWWAVFATAVLIPFPTVAGPAMVFAYLGASVYLELHPPEP